MYLYICFLLIVEQFGLYIRTTYNSAEILVLVSALPRVPLTSILCSDAHTRKDFVYHFPWNGSTTTCFPYFDLIPCISWCAYCHLTYFILFVYLVTVRLPHLH